jgi:hypothetical protein
MIKNPAEGFFIFSTLEYQNILLSSGPKEKIKDDGLDIPDE